MDPSLNISTLREIWKESDEEHWLPVQGISMQPVLHEGDSICISHDLSGVKMGDILVFQQAGGLVAHRLVRIVRRSNQMTAFQTKGDNCTRFDPSRNSADILGRVVSIRKYGREIDLTTPGNRFWNGLVAGYHFLLGNAFQVLRSIKQRFLKPNN
jgi:signal peptidase I